ncbi:DUF3826 domain-containing protein [Bacteroidales bacterium OttesenSCG-928-L03]|nr:DUF3826 domain-containing protein [Bacteroidales bacterium OttesenSCG-928-L03]
MKKVILLLFGICLVISSQAQQDDAEYTRVLTERSEKIVKTLGIEDAEVYQRVTEIMVQQYKNLGLIHDGYDTDLKVVKASEMTKEEKEAATTKLTLERDQKLYNLHCAYIGSLSSELNEEQVIRVKDGMTFGVVKVTYDSYCDMIPTLKEDEKRQLMAWLVEAREHAMDAPSSKAKHEWFGKYKGRFNNYLSKQGYDIQKERTEWNKRLEEAKKK